MTRKEHEECIKLVIDHWRNRYLKLETQLEKEREIHHGWCTISAAERDRLLKKQEDYFHEADQFQRFLAGYISARRMCELVGFAENKNTLAPILLQLQTAHDDLLDRGFQDRLKLIVSGLQKGLIDRAAAHRLLGLKAQKVQELLFGNQRV